MATQHSDEIPEDVRRFVTDAIDSVEQLQVLLILFEQPTRVWRVAELTAQLRSSDGSIEKRLNDLYDRKVLRRPGAQDAAHRFELFDPALLPVIQKLAEVHRQRPYRIIDLIYSRPNDALKAFADAFKIKKDR